MPRALSHLNPETQRVPLAHTLPYLGTAEHDGPPAAFLPRLLPAARGSFPRGPFVSNWRGYVGPNRIPVLVTSTRAVRGVAHHLVAAPNGDWISYREHVKTGLRRRTGDTGSPLSNRIATAFGV